MDGEINNCCCY